MSFARAIGPIILLLWMVWPAAAQDIAQAGITLSAAAGFDGYYKGEYWLPVTVTVANSGPSVEGEVRVVAGNGPGQEIVYSSPLSLPSQSSKQVVLFVYLQDWNTRLTATLVDDQGRELGRTQTGALNRLAADGLLYGVVSPEAGALQFLASVKGERSEAAVAALELADLPAVAAAWNALDVLVLHDVDTGQWAAGQLAALTAWVEAGGQLVVTGGPGWAKTTAALSDLLPVSVTGSQTTDDLPALSQATGEPFRDPGPYLVAASTLRRGELLIHQDGLPLLARQAVGRGSVYFLALDPTLVPLAGWDGQAIIWDRVAAGAPELPPWGMGAQSGYAADSAVTSLPSLTVPSSLQLLLFLFLYAIVVGPVNYFVLKGLKRRELAWITIPAVVVFFSALAYLTGFRLKGNAVIVNQMSIAYGHANSQAMRVQSLVGLYSPRRAEYDLVFPGDTAVRPFSQEFGPGLLSAGNLEAVERSADVRLINVRVDVSGMETFVAESYRPAPAVRGQATLEWSSEQAHLQIEVQNQSNFTLEDATVLIGATAVPLGDLEAGQSRSQRQNLTGLGSSSGFSPAPYSTAPLALHYETLLGSADYMNDPALFPRWQLLESLAAPYGPGSSTPTAAAVTLVGWSTQSQVAVNVEEIGFLAQATTLYLLELPFAHRVNQSSSLSLPPALISATVLPEGSVYVSGPSYFGLSAGWVAFEFQPWSDFGAMTVSELKIALRAQGMVSSPAPTIFLWNWSEQSWMRLEDGDWGMTAVPDPTPFTGPGNRIRIRLDNNSIAYLDIQEVYPVLTVGRP
ncbi:MAG: hypothetical protein AB1791_12115 [Chloroflexota bacterium]